MGTSASSTGPNNQSPLIPSWAEQSPSVTVEPAQGSEGENETNQGGKETDNEKVQHEIGKPIGTANFTNRFAGARREFGKYAKTGGSSSDLRRALKSYSKKGSGGGKTTSRRLASGITAGTGLLGVMRGDTVTVNNQNLSLRDLKGLSTDQAIDRIASHLAPDNADSDSVRIALDYALEEALPDTEDFDPNSFTEEVIQQAIGCYLTDLIFQDVVEGMGRAWFHVEPASKHHSMEVELRELIKVIAQEQLDKVTNGNPSNITRDNITKIQADAIAMTVEEWESFDD
ncbi:hypothetical protein EAY27_03065 [Vibrio anguillarum]|uniref:Uncharacterized protein n=9 Tax=Vibrio TaxID=662 RepID=A0A9X4ISY7_9VIBR|nr:MULTISPECIES: hypothetical protein [Vibrio]ASW83163.1 hypothetical protein CK207_19445 [Vibrio anguillarum]AXN05028.1 hypothetical protein DD610_12505 [Vibrio anguillarum]AZS27347.1 hypothetical protein DYL72_20990 [Vibrio anguillarum]MBF4276189.1 hypothetical protein [Vibrio anguillarum]MBF4310080.1 hypothetical protein [Vibrio anguillarum]